MLCPNCKSGAYVTRTMDTDDISKRRYCVCPCCGYHFKTVEVIREKDRKKEAKTDGERA